MSSHLIRPLSSDPCEEGHLPGRSAPFGTLGDAFASTVDICHGSKHFNISKWYSSDDFVPGYHPTISCRGGTVQRFRATAGPWTWLSFWWCGHSSSSSVKVLRRAHTAHETHVNVKQRWTYKGIGSDVFKTVFSQHGLAFKSFLEHYLHGLGWPWET